jgi:hypothetical protein
MAESRAGLNVIMVSGREFLLVETAGGGRAAHVALKAEPDEACRGAIPAEWFEDDGLLRQLDLGVRYDLEILREPFWSVRTLCGREWLDMAGGAGGPLSDYGLDAYAPSCRRCLASLDRLFPSVLPDDRIGLLSRLATDAVRKVGSAVLKDVPGDQMEPLRRAVRRAIRNQLGYKSNTIVIENTLHVVSDEAFEVVRDSQMKEAAMAMERILAGIEPEQSDPGHVISWRVLG